MFGIDWRAGIGLSGPVSHPLACCARLAQVRCPLSPVAHLRTSSQNAVKRKESWKALEELHKIGKVKAIGVSNYTISHLKELMEYAEIMPHVNQVEYHPNCQQPELAEFCKMHNILLQPYSPFGQGRVGPLLRNHSPQAIWNRRGIETCSKAKQGTRSDFDSLGAATQHG